jgi:hypothetical protein
VIVEVDNDTVVVMVTLVVVDAVDVIVEVAVTLLVLLMVVEVVDVCVAVIVTLVKVLVVVPVVVEVDDDSVDVVVRLEPV